ncbi:MAG TPA: chorismate mutase [Candidatus Acidoferrum sp.]|nr:chorismate mutase [Candidatus Acidoferrum sp.]
MATSSTIVIPSDARNLSSSNAEAAPMTLADLRRRIDELDRKLVELLNERSKCALEIGKLKQEQHLPLYQPDREKEVLQNAEHNNRGPLSNAAVRRLFERIIDEARSAERLAMHTDGDAEKDS